MRFTVSSVLSNRPGSSSSLARAQRPLSEAIRRPSSPWPARAGSANQASLSLPQASEDAARYGWQLSDSQPDFSGDPQVREIPVASIRRPLAGTRANDQAKVEALMRSIEETGLHEPIDVLDVDGDIWGFSGCHRFEAHQRLGKPTILCRVRKANRQVLRFHMM